MSPTLKQLRYFAALSELLHFRRAAGACNVSQPALSAQVRELETVLGVRLVERTTQAVALTPVGAEVARRAKAILSEVGDLVDFARHKGKVLYGPLRLGMIASVSPYLLPLLLPQLERRFPALRLQVRESVTATLLDELAAGQLDAALVALPVPGDSLAAIALFEDPFLLVVRREHELTRREGIRADDIAHERLLLLEEGHCLRDQALDFCRWTKAGQLEGLGATSLATLVQMVAHGYGLTLIPELCLEGELGGRPDLRALRFAPPTPGRRLGLVWRQTSPRRGDFEALGAAVRELRRGAAARAA